jgi:hypothetical protein
MVVSSNLDVLDLVDLLGFVEAFGSLPGYDSRNCCNSFITVFLVH